MLPAQSRGLQNRLVRPAFRLLPDEGGTLASLEYSEERVIGVETPGLGHGTQSRRRGPTHRLRAVDAGGQTS
jgi:hypothetical protein